MNQAEVVNLERVDAAIQHLRLARDLLVAARAPRAADKVRSALKSAEGARRNVTVRGWRESWNARTTYTEAIADDIPPEEDEDPGSSGAKVPARPRPGRGPLDSAARELAAPRPRDSGGAA